MKRIEVLTEDDIVFEKSTFLMRNYQDSIELRFLGSKRLLLLSMEQSALLPKILVGNSLCLGSVSAPTKNLKNTLSSFLYVFHCFFKLPDFQYRN